MVKMAKRFSILLLAALILVCSPAVSMLAEGAAYTYTVRFYSGQQGTFSGGREVMVFEGLSYGSVVSFNQGGVTLKDGSKYYVKGIRESGRDNNTVSASAFVVTGDMDYVVAYGLRGNMVAYTVNYVDESGAALAPSDIYYGNVGDKPVVAFLYIDGYVPQAYNLTRTLVENEAENVFTFVYVPLAAGTGDEIVTRTVLPGTDRSVVEIIPGDTFANRSHKRDTSSLNIDRVNADADAHRNDMDMSDFADDLDRMSLADPLSGIDLDDGVDLTDPAVPLADMRFKLGPIEVGARLLLIMIVILVAVSVVVAASWWYWKPYRKKENDEEKSAAQPV